MKITKIYIRAFGGLRDKTLELSDGFNCIFGENENGKTTLMTFLKMMFYGSGRAGSRQLEKNPRKRYQPWSGEKMGGRVYFEHGGKRWCLEREFRGSDSTDRVILRDLDLGSGETVSPDIGKRFFSLSDSAFERSVFIGKPAFPIDEEASGEIGARLSNLAATGNENSSYQLIKNRITAALSELKTQRHVGKYDKGVIELEELKRQLSAADSAAIRRAELTERIKDYTAKIKSASAQSERLQRMADSENDRLNARQLENFLEAKAQLDKMYGDITLSDGTRADESFIRRVDFCLSRCSATAERRADKQNETKRLSETISLSRNQDRQKNTERAAELKERLNRLSQDSDSLLSEIDSAQASIDNASSGVESAQRAKKAFNPALLGISAAVLAAAILLFVFKLTVPATAAALAGVLFAVLAFILRPADRAAAAAAAEALAAARSEKAEKETERAELLNKANRCVTELNIITAALGSDEAVLEQRKADLSVKTEELEQLNKAFSEQSAELFSLSEKFCSSHDLTEISSARDILSENARRVDGQKAVLNSLAKALNNISYDEARQRLEKLSANGEPLADNEISDVKEQLSKLRKLIIELNGEQRDAAAELKRILETADDPEYISKKIHSLEKTLEEQEEYYCAAQLSLEVLDESVSELRRGYGAALEKETAEIFSGITGGKYKAVSISRSLEMEAEQDNEIITRSTDYLSSGTVDQAYLSMRLAAARLISADEPLPLFLDDSLSQCDDARTERALKFLKNYSEDKQLLFFTCHGAVYNIAASLGADCKSLERN